MSSEDLMIRVRGLGKSYQIVHQAEGVTTLAEAAVRRLRSPMRRVERETFWALQDVSFDVRRGDVIGVIGRNGAGKSTLFKVLSRITEPTAGRVDLYGRVGSLLEVGTGFSGELTGRENIYLNGTILGMRRAEIARRFDEIVDFSGVERFLDTPVKRYSSGMYVRLAFAVAAHLDPEILIVDEVLAVGDAEFQEKCLGRIKAVAKGGRTVLFVSHNMNSVRGLCDKAMFMQAGRCGFVGDVDEAIALYEQQGTQAVELTVDASRRTGSGEYRFTKIEPGRSTFRANEPKTLDFEIVRHGPAVSGPFLVFEFRDAHDSVVARCDTRLLGRRIDGGERYAGTVELRTPWLKPGRYNVAAQIDSGAGYIDLVPFACSVDVGAVLPYQPAHEDAIRSGLVLSDFDITFDRAAANQPAANDALDAVPTA